MTEENPLSVLVHSINTNFGAVAEMIKTLWVVLSAASQKILDLQEQVDRLKEALEDIKADIPPIVKDY